MRTLPIQALVLIFTFTLGINHTATSQNLKSNDLPYKVIINHEEQYVIWPSGQPIPRAWKETGISGDQAKCREYIEEVWTDMRPLSIRKMNLPKNTEYAVVINHEEQYSIWPAERALPKGWQPAGAKGSLDKCREYIEEVWTDMRPLSVRKGKGMSPRRN